MPRVFNMANNKDVSFAIKHPRLRPHKSSSGAAGYDLKVTEKLLLPPLTTMSVDAGLTVRLPYNIFGHIVERSSMAKLGLQVRGGIIDSDYSGPSFLILYNATSTNAIEVDQFAMVAQMVLHNRPGVRFAPMPDSDDYGIDYSMGWPNDPPPTSDFTPPIFKPTGPGVRLLAPAVVVATVHLPPEEEVVITTTEAVLPIRTEPVQAITVTHPVAIPNKDNNIPPPHASGQQDQVHSDHASTDTPEDNSADVPDDVSNSSSEQSLEE